MMDFMSTWFNKRAERAVDTAVGSAMLSRIQELVFSESDEYKAPETFAAMADVYSKSPDMRAAVDYISGVFRSVLWESTNDELLLILNRPSDTMAGTFWEVVIQNLYLAGRAFIYPVTAKSVETGKKYIKKLSILNPDMVTVNTVNTTDITGFTYQPDKDNHSTKKEYKTDELFYLWFPNPVTPLHGVSPFVAAARGLEVGVKGREWNVGLIKNGAKVGGVLNVPGYLAQNQIEEHRRAINQRAANKSGRGGVVVTHSGATFTPNGLSPVDMDWMNTQSISLNDACKVVKIDPLVLQNDVSGSYQNKREAMRNTHAQTILPLLRWVSGELGSFFTRFYDGVPTGVSCDEGSVPYSQLLMVDLYEKVAQSDFMTDNEKRNRTGFPPVVGGDVLWKSTALVDIPVIPKRSEDRGTRDAVERPDAKKLRSNELRMRKAFSAMFDEEGRRVVAAVNNSSELTIDSVIESTLDMTAGDWYLVYEAQVLETSGVFASDAYDKLKRSRVELKPWEPLVKEWVEFEGLRRVTEISHTTRLRLRGVVSQSISDGLSIPNIAKAISAEYDGMSRIRATAIARTEVISSSNLGVISGARSTGLGLKKYWLVSLDGRERPEHAEAGSDYTEDTAIPEDQPFVVAGESMDFPGDTSLGASASNVVNCRCSVAMIAE